MPRALFAKQTVSKKRTTPLDRRTQESAYHGWLLESGREHSREEADNRGRLRSFKAVDPIPPEAIPLQAADCIHLGFTTQESRLPIFVDLPCCRMPPQKPGAA